MDGFGGIPGNGALIGVAANMPQRPYNVYEEHAAAVKEWHEACQDFQRAEARKGEARMRLDDVTKKLGDHVSCTAHDPTVPRTEECCTPYRR